MSEANCRFVATDQPRAICDREHAPRDPMCEDCEPCTRSHCRIDGHVHVVGACAGCMTDIRTDLGEIGRLYADLPAEVEHRGINGEAFVLLGPAANPEAFGHVKASVATGRLPKEALGGR